MDAMDGMLVKALGHGELTEPMDGQVAVPGAGATTAVGLRRGTASLEVVQSNCGAEEGADMSEDNSMEELSAGGPGMYTGNGN